MTLLELNLPDLRVNRALERAGITTAEELARWRPRDLLLLQAIGPERVGYIREALANVGLHLANDPLLRHGKRAASAGA
jgi:DNA-directed RNA polymerase alpha subunit